MQQKDLVFIQDQIGYNFQNIDLLQQAFVRRSYSNRPFRSLCSGNVSSRSSAPARMAAAWSATAPKSFHSRRCRQKNQA